MKKINFLLVFLISSAVFINAQTNADLAKAVNYFLSTLNAEQTQQTVYSFKDSLRHKWTNLPIGLVPRPGIAYGSLSDQSRLAFHRVLATMLSSQGYLKTTSIMQLDDILNTLYQDAFDQGKINQLILSRMQNLKWAHGNYFISVFGQPKEKEPWGLNFGGHHMALNITSDGTTVLASPYFIGTDPSEVKSGKYAGLRVLAKEEDYGFMLVNMLTESQRSKAVLKQAVPGDIITSPNSSQRITDYYGIAAAEFSTDQKAMLEILMQEYIHNFEHQAAHRLYDKILKSGIDKIYFAWIGSLENNKSHYYIIHGPDFIIEYDNDGFQKDGNHIHAILREKGNDFGEDILKAHYLEVKH